ncbi:hypothetical protein LDENG_00254450 [Lucifuga dentata]|nr:hypothetical protein LDENG_00254450 [Lucifuga dentata]
MDPAHTPSSEDRLERIEKVLQQHEERIDATGTTSSRAWAVHEQAITALATLVQQLTPTPFPTSAPVQAAALSPVATPPGLPRMVSEPRVGTPERYAGEPEGCNPFLINCSILFALQPLTFSNEEAKVAYAISHLTGRARMWGTAEWDRHTSACSSFQAFSAELRKVFGMGISSYDSAQSLLKMHHGDQTVTDYAIDFRIRARQSEWNMAALCDAYLNGLADYVKDELVSHDLPTTLDGLIDLTTRIDLRIQARRREKSQRSARRQSPQHHRRILTVINPSGPDSSGRPEPMQLGRTSLAPEERERRRQLNLCLYCGQAGHFVSRCPVKGRAHQ